MNKQDAYKVIAKLQAFYPDGFRNLSDDAVQLKVTLWQKQFEDESAAWVHAGVDAYISTDTRGFMPVPGQIKEQISILRNQETLSDQDAWEMVTNALRNSAYGAKEEFAKLPTDVQRAVGSPNMLKDWASTNFSDLQTVIASNFKRDYRAIVDQKRNLEKIPKAVKQLPECAATDLLDES